MIATQHKGIESKSCNAVRKVVIRTATMIVFVVLIAASQFVGWPGSSRLTPRLMPRLMLRPRPSVRLRPNRSIAAPVLQRPRPTRA